MRLYLIRHGRPEVGAGICYGSADLTVPAHEDARVVAAVAPHLPRVATIHTSPLRRCAGLAQRLAEAIGGADVIRDTRLAEIQFGKWELCAWDDIPRAEIDAWTADLRGYRPGGGESLSDMASRVRAFHRELLRQDCDEAVVVCHAGTIRLLLQWRQGSIGKMVAAAARDAHAPAYGEVVVVDC